MKTLSLARAAAVAALLVLGAGCAGAQHAAPGAGRSSAPGASGAPDSSRPAPGPASSATPTAVTGTTVAASMFGRVFTNPALTSTGGGVYLSWWLNSPRRFPPRMVLARADATTGRIVTENQFSPGFIGTPMYAAGSLWVTDATAAGELLLRLDPRALMVTGELKIGGPYHPGGMAGEHLAFAAGSIWADGGDQLIEVAPGSVSVTRTIPLPGALTSDVAASPDGGTLIVSEAGDGGAGTVQRRDPATGALLASHSMTGVLAPVIGGVSGADAWIAEPTGMMGYVERFRTAAMTPDEATQVEGTNGIRVRIWNGVLWVTNPVGGPARNYCADPGTGRRLATLSLPDMNEDTLLAVGGKDLYYSQSSDGGSRIAATPVLAACLSVR